MRQWILFIPEIWNWLEANYRPLTVILGDYDDRCDCLETMGQSD